MISNLPKELKTRKSDPSDHPKIIKVMEDWWNGRDLTFMLPRLFLVHFCDTSFIVEKENELIAFLVGFLSPNRKSEGYIHFVGVHPECRNSGIGAYLYGRFFQICIENQYNIVRSCTSPVNTGSIVFHTKIGFEIENGNSVVDGVQVTLDYNKPNDPKVLFKKTLLHNEKVDKL